MLNKSQPKYKNAAFLPSITLLLLAVLLAMGCGEEQEQYQSRRQQTVGVVVEPVRITSQLTRVEAVGNSRALRSITLHPATSGAVVAVHFQPGQFVQQGDVLLELDQRDEKLAVELAQVKLQETERLYERYKKSADSGATLPTTLDAAKTALDSARIELDRARVNLDDRTIEAPFSGFVGITDVDAGDRIQNTTTITTLDDRSFLLVSFAVPELLVGKIKVGNKVGIHTWNADATQANGEVIDIDSRINPETRTFITRARVDNNNDALRPGMSFRVTLDIAGDDYPVLPEVALQWGTDGSYVWTVIAGKAQRQPVNIVQRQEGKVLVEANLNPDSLIIVEGIQRLRPGIEVEIQNSVPSPSQHDRNTMRDATPDSARLKVSQKTLFATRATKARVDTSTMARGSL